MTLGHIVTLIGEESGELFLFINGEWRRLGVLFIIGNGAGRLLGGGLGLLLLVLGEARRWRKGCWVC